MVSSAAALSAMTLVYKQVSAGTDDPFWYGPDGQRCPVGWDAGGHSDEANDQCCEFGRDGDTANCHAPEIYFPPHDDNPDVCCYWRTEINKYYYRPTKVVGKWMSMGALDPTHNVCRTVGSEMSESLTENFQHQVTDSLSSSVGVEFEGISASTTATHEVQDTWSTSSAWSQTLTESTTDCEDADAIQQYVDNGWVWRWQWSAETTTMWGTTYTTEFPDSAYTPNRAHPPLCAPGFFAEGHYPDYQECDDGSKIGLANQFKEELLV